VQPGFSTSSRPFVYPSEVVAFTCLSGVGCASLYKYNSFLVELPFFGSQPSTPLSGRESSKPAWSRPRTCPAFSGEILSFSTWLFLFPPPPCLDISFSLHVSLLQTAEARRAGSLPLAPCSNRGWAPPGSQASPVFERSHLIRSFPRIPDPAPPCISPGKLRLISEHYLHRGRGPPVFFPAAIRSSTS